MPRSSGIPSIERVVGQFLIRRWCAKNPPERTTALLREQQRQLALIVGNAGERATSPVRIKRLPGLEASSTNYSLAMVADHLARVNTGIARTLELLARNERDTRVVVIADYKPSQSAQPGQSMDDLDRSIVDLERVLADIARIRCSTTTHAHPWFGELPATTWACFPAFHTVIHLKQAALIATGLPAKA